MSVSEKDTLILRELAEKYISYAFSDKNSERRELWRKLNCMNMQKPMVTIDQIPWDELNTDGSLTNRVEDNYFRGIETTLLRSIYKFEHLQADTVLDPYIVLPRAISNSGFGLTTQRLKHSSNGTVCSHLFEDQLEELEDVQKIHTPTISINTELEAEILFEAERIFGGIAPLQWGGIMLHSGLWDSITFWKGVESCYIDLIERPELIHAIMERYTTAFIEHIEEINRLELYSIQSNNCHCSYTFNDRISDEERLTGSRTTYNGWTFSMAQLFTSVSPEVNREFELPYMSRIFGYFDSVYYGCCERLDDRLDIICQMPNIRKISCSPWSDREHFASVLPKKYIMSNKPTPSYLAGSSFDEDIVREDIRRTIKAAKENGLGLELLLKDISTVRNDPARLWRWSEIAAEETANAAIG
ncbi:MAG: hypothetical protein IJY24_03350 [Clostridia bacterium]|nr:hypothetical protein [Clostridia bacterium]